MVHGTLLIERSLVMRIKPVFIKTYIATYPELIINNFVFTKTAVAQ
jgi:hypothetical protein